MLYTNNYKRKLVKDDYNVVADLFAEASTDLETYKNHIDMFVSKLNGKKVLDVACGAGLATAYLTGLGLEATGLDFAENLINIARANHPDTNYVAADICKYKTKEKFDGIFTKNALFHLPDRDLKKVLKKFYNILNNGGRLCVILDIPKEAGEQILVEPLDNRYKLYYNYLQPQKVETLLTIAGFTIENKIIEADSDYVYASGVMVFQAYKQV